MNAVLYFFSHVEPKYQQYVQNLTQEFQSNLAVHLRHFQVQCLESAQPWGIWLIKHGIIFSLFIQPFL